MDVFDITASALTAQRLRLDTISSNLANVNTTRQEDGSIGAYRRKTVVFAPMLEQAQQGFGPGVQDGPSIQIDGNDGPYLRAGISHTQLGHTGVQVVEIDSDTNTPMRRVYDPNHPDSGEDGYVEMPNVNVVSEMVDMISASRAYEASITAFQSTKQMNENTLNM